MAGTLPGVESARRRRFPASAGQRSDSFGSTRNRGFYDTHFSFSSFSQRSVMNISDDDEKLGGVARKAKERLHERLRSQRKPEINRQERSWGATLMEETRRKVSSSIAVRDLQTEVFRLKKKSSWAKIGLNWESSDQDECVVCLEKFKVGEKLDRLPCAHRFHSMCLLPWLESHAHCPCCRMSVLGSNH